MIYDIQTKNKTVAYKDPSLARDNRLILQI
jgi:hypothetical protein